MTVVRHASRASADLSWCVASRASGDGGGAQALGRDAAVPHRRRARHRGARDAAPARSARRQDRRPRQPATSPRRKSLVSRDCAIDSFAGPTGPPSSPAPAGPRGSRPIWSRKASTIPMPGRSSSRGAPLAERVAAEGDEAGARARHRRADRSPRTGRPSSRATCRRRRRAHANAHRPNTSSSVTTSPARGPLRRLRRVRGARARAGRRRLLERLEPHPANPRRSRFRGIERRRLRARHVGARA